MYDTAGLLVVCCGSGCLVFKCLKSSVVGPPLYHMTIKNMVLFYLHKFVVNDTPYSTNNVLVGNIHHLFCMWNISRLSLLWGCLDMDDNMWHHPQWYQLSWCRSLFLCCEMCCSSIIHGSGSRPARIKWSTSYPTMLSLVSVPRDTCSSNRFTVYRGLNTPVFIKQFVVWKPCF